MRFGKRCFVGSLTLAALLLSTTGCFNTDRQKLLGIWQVDIEMDAADLGKSTPLENPWVASLGNMLMRSLQMVVQLDFRSDDTCTLAVSAVGNTFTRNGRWRVENSQGTAVTVLTLFDGDSEPRAWEIRFLDDNSFQTVPPAGSQLSVSRVVTFSRMLKK